MSCVSLIFNSESEHCAVQMCISSILFEDYWQKSLLPHHCQNHKPTKLTESTLKYASFCISFFLIVAQSASPHSLRRVNITLFSSLIRRTLAAFLVLISQEFLFSSNSAPFVSFILQTLMIYILFFSLISFLGVYTVHYSDPLSGFVPIPYPTNSNHTPGCIYLTVFIAFTTLTGERL